VNARFSPTQSCSRTADVAGDQVDKYAVSPDIHRHYTERWDESRRLASTVKGQLESTRLYDFLET
jgi:hypothetical protein